MTDKVAILVFKESGKYYTGSETRFYDVPEGMNPWNKEFDEWVITHEVTSPDNFTFLVLEPRDNKHFWTRLITPHNRIFFINNIRKEDEQIAKIIDILKSFYNKNQISDIMFEEVAKQIVQLER